MAAAPVVSYRPREGSLPDRVCRYFAANPDEELSVSDIVLKFDVADRKNLNTMLNLPVASGLLARINGSSYRAGPRINDMMIEEEPPQILPGPDTPVSAFGLLANAAKTQQRRKAAPPLDVDAIELKKATPPPPRHGNEGTNWSRLFARMAPGTGHEHLHSVYYGSASKAAATWRKAHPDQEIVVRRIDDQRCGVYRIK